MEEIKKSEKQVCEYLGIPSIPIKAKWDGKSPFTRGVAVIHRITDVYDYACCAFNPETDDSVNIVKDFGDVPFNQITEVYPLAAWMEDNIQGMDLSDSSKEAMEALLQEKREKIKDGTEEPKKKEYEWGYEFIHDKKEALAFLKTKNIKGKMPAKEEVIKAKLRVMYREENKQKK